MSIRKGASPASAATDIGAREVQMPLGQRPAFSSSDHPTTQTTRDERPISEIKIGERHRRDLVGDVDGLAASISDIRLDGDLVAGARTATMAFHPLADVFPLIEGTEFEALVTDIRMHGVREPVATLDGKILDGRNRYRAAHAAGVACPVSEYDGDDPVAFVISLNLKRRHLSESQRAMVAAKLATMHQGARTDLSPIGETSQATAAKLLNVGKRSVERATVVRDKAAPELREAVEQGAVAISTAADVASVSLERQREIIAALPRDADGKLTADAKRALAPFIREIRAEKVQKMRAVRDAREAALAGKQLALPQRRYGVIYADPPWKFETWGNSDAGRMLVADNHYPCCELPEIMALEVPSISADDCALFLWATAPMLPHAHKVMDAWGFRYITHAIWNKDRSGTGYWLLNKHELLLIGTRGNAPCPAPGMQWASVIDAARGRHSEKPNVFYELIEAYFPNLPKIELFARKARKDWDRWGFEAPDDDLEAAP